MSRIAMLVLGLVAAAWGVYELLGRGWSNLTATAWWLVGGVVLHDFVFAPAVLLLCLIGLTVVPSRMRGVLTGALIVWGTVSITAIPVLGRFGARPDNPTLLDRNYGIGYLVSTLLVAVIAGGAGVRATPRQDPSGAQRQTARRVEDLVLWWRRGP